MAHPLTRIARLPPPLLLAGVSIFALLVRLIVYFQVSQDPNFHHITGDGLAYLKWAAAIQQGDWIGHEVFYQSPLYPYLVAIFQKLTDRDLLDLLVVQAILG